MKVKCGKQEANQYFLQEQQNTLLIEVWQSDSEEMNSILSSNF